MTLTESDSRPPEPDEDEPVAEGPREEDEPEDEPGRCSFEGGVVRLGS